MESSEKSLPFPPEGLPGSEARVLFRHARVLSFAKRVLCFGKRVLSGKERTLFAMERVLSLEESVPQMLRGTLSLSPGRCGATK